MSLPITAGSLAWNPACPIQDGLVSSHPLLQRSMEDRDDWVRMEKKMETIIMENQMDKKMKNEMETGIILGCIRDFGA